jgi:hypothetical protein
VCVVGPQYNNFGKRKTQISLRKELFEFDLPSSKQISRGAYQQATAETLNHHFRGETSLVLLSLEESSIATSLTRVCTAWRIHLLLLCVTVKLWCTSRFHFVLRRTYFPRIRTFCCSLLVCLSVCLCFKTVEEAAA